MVFNAFFFNSEEVPDTPSEHFEKGNDSGEEVRLDSKSEDNVRWNGKDPRGSEDEVEDHGWIVEGRVVVG